jgi:hypothetical protein
VPAEIEPPGLANLVDLAERPRVQQWSLRAALVRYSQAEPQRVENLLQLVRRVEGAFGAHRAQLERNGPQLWAELEHAGPEADGLLGILQAARELDRLGDVLAAWAVDRQGDRPNAPVDDVVGHVARRLEALGVPAEEPVPRGARSEEGRRRRRA